MIKAAEQRHPKEAALIRKAEQDVVRNMFGSLEELKSAVYAALVHYLVLRGYLHYGPFDAAWNEDANLDDLDKEKIRWWTEMAREKRKWFVSATVKCVQFYGTKVQKPMAFQQVYGGSVFEMVDQATAFVMSHIDARVGERTSSAQVDVDYELTWLVI